MVYISISLTDNINHLYIFLIRTGQFNVAISHKRNLHFALTLSRGSLEQVEHEKNPTKKSSELISL